MTQQQSAAEMFKALHERPGIFVIPNPWDIGSAKLLAQLGFEALATSSAGFAYSLGKPDGGVTREEALAHCRALVAATPLPVSADLENCYSDDPTICAETIQLAAETGLAGCSIEDATGRDEDPIYSFELSVERVKAAVQAVRKLSVPFTLTARAENLIKGRPDLPDTIRRLEAYAEAGADVLFAPGLRTKDEVDAAVHAVAPRPVNVIMGLAGVDLSVNELAALGVKRVSLGSSLARAAYGALLQAMEEVRTYGTFRFANGIVSYPDINRMFLGGGSEDV